MICAISTERLEVCVLKVSKTQELVDFRSQPAGNSAIQDALQYHDVDRDGKVSLEELALGSPG